MKYFSNAKVAVKLSIFASIAVLMLLSLCLVGYFGLERQTAAMEDLYEKRFSSVVGVAAASDNILDAHANIYKVVNLVNLGKPEGQIDAEIAKFLKKLDTAQEKLLTLAGLDSSKAAQSGQDLEAIKKRIDGKKGIIDQVLGELNQQSGVAGTAEDRTLQLTELTSLAIDAYQLTLEEIMPTVKLMDMIGADVAAGMMEGSEQSFLLIVKAIETLRSFNAAHAQMAYQASMESEAAANTKFILVGLISIFLLSLFTVIIVRSISVPLKQTVVMLKELGHGHLRGRLNLNRSDEIGDMANTLDSFANSLQNEMVEPLKMLADGDLTFRVTPHDSEDEIRNALQKVGYDLNQIVIQTQSAGNQIDSASDLVSATSQSLSQGATETAASLEEISSSMNEMASQTTQSANSATQANLLAEEAQSAAAKGSEHMSGMSAAMGEISESGQSISKIIKVIDEIAFQTNLLALNAAVEAARAGQHGKGFAVVAEEVRNLAARSAKAAQETSELIEGSVSKTNNGKQIAEQTSVALEDIVTSVGKMGALVSEIAVASQEQAQGISQINLGLGQIDQAVQQSTATSEESASAAEELSSQATQLRQILERFRVADLNPQTSSSQGFGSEGKTSPQIGWRDM